MEKIMSVKYLFIHRISCRFINEATIPISYRFLVSQFATLKKKKFYTKMLELLNLITIIVLWSERW